MEKVIELKETHLRRIRTVNKMIDNPLTPKERRDRLEAKLHTYKCFIVELEDICGDQ